MVKHSTIAVIGAGPSGLIAAEILAQGGHSVTVYDRMPSVGRKLLMAGRGGLNLTHSEPVELFLKRYGSAAQWLAPYINAFPPDALRRWCEGLGQETFIGSSGRVFPRTMKTAPLLRAWLARFNRLGVRFAMKHHWQGWDKDTLKFSDAAGQLIFVKADATLLALGGASWPRLGSDGGWVSILEKAGVKLAPLQPANCGFTVAWSDYFKSRFSGEPLKPVALSYNGVSRQGEMMITEQGIEGGAVYVLSGPLRDGITKTGLATIHLDLRPALTQYALAQKLQASRGSKSLSSYLRSNGFSPVAIALLHEVTTREAVKEASASVLAAQLKSLPLILNDTVSITRAISTAGGITQSAVNEQLMLREKTGVFVAGEMLDWEAPTGGYLLQACFATGVAAAKNIITYCN